MRKSEKEMRKAMNKKFLGLLSLVCCLWSAASVALSNPKVMQTPTQAIQELDRMVDQYRVGKNLTEADRQFNQQLKQRILRGTFDLRELSRLALNKYWNERTPKERDRFVELLTNILEERSVFSKERAVEKGQEQPYRIRYKGDIYLNKDKTDAMVKTVIRIKSKNISIDLDYRLKKVGQEWKIYDVIMDGASLVDNYRYSFGSIIRKNGYPELVRRMESKLAEFREKRS